VAEDLVEETWLRLVVHARRLRVDTRLGPWLFTVARHLYASYCRSRLLEHSHAAGLIGLWPYGRPEPSPFEAVEASEAQRRAATVLASLPLAYREALLLVAVEGLQHSEAAEICGVTVAAMRQRVSRARALFARRLTDAEVPGLTSLKEITTLTSYDPHDAGFEGLKRLQFLAPDSGRADRVRMRCRTQLARGRKRPARTDATMGFTGRVLVPVVVGGFCVLYIAALVATTVRLHAVLF
jgi:RNA polymerase sigma-70 factor (ECF subfamily)